MDKQGKTVGHEAAEQIHDLGEFFRQQVAPVQKATGATRVAEELVKRGMHEAAAVALQVAAKLMGGASAAPEAWFVQQWEGQPPASRAPLADLKAANSDDLHVLCFLENAKPGDELKTGGGAAPACTVRRV